MNGDGGVYTGWLSFLFCGCASQTHASAPHTHTAYTHTPHGLFGRRRRVGQINIDFSAGASSLVCMLCVCVVGERRDIYRSTIVAQNDVSNVLVGG